MDQYSIAISLADKGYFFVNSYFFFRIGNFFDAHLSIHITINCALIPLD